MNYNFSIPVKKQRPWYDDFVRLINQIDTVLKHEELLRIQKDEEIRNYIDNYTFSTTLWIPIPVNDINRPFARTTSTSFVPATTGMVNFYLPTKNFGIDIQKISMSKIILTVRGQRYSGSQGGELYVQIEYTTNKDIETASPIWVLPVQSFNTDSYDPNWLNCAYILYDTEIPTFLFDKIGYYNFQTYFRSKDGGEVSFSYDRIILLYRITNQG